MTEIVVPEVGMGCTTGYGSDCYPHTIVKLVHFQSGPRKGEVKGFWMQDDIARATPDSNYYGTQKYTYEFDPNAEPVLVTLRSDGKWKIAGDTKRVHVGYRSYYRDPSF